MGLTHSQLTFKALVALDEVVTACRAGPVQPTATLRFVLAWLFTHSKDDDRSSYDAFWRIVQDDMSTAYSQPQANYQRGSIAMTELMEIARRAGYELTSDLQCDLYQARMNKTERERYRASPAFKFAQNKRIS